MSKRDNEVRSAERPQRVKDVPSNLRPREQFDRAGAENVSEEVLVALILRSGVRGRNVMDLARKLLVEYGSLTTLAQASVDELTRHEGMGRVKAQVLKAALELGQRLAREVPNRREVRTPADAARLLRETAQVQDREVFWVLPLDKKNRLRRSPVEITTGLADASLVHPREVYKEAIRASSAAVVLVHNHPSGDPTPSSEDVRITRQLVDAGRIVDIRVLDHVILGRPDTTGAPDYFSLRDAGLVDFSN